MRLHSESPFTLSVNPIIYFLKLIMCLYKLGQAGAQLKPYQQTMYYSSALDGWVAWLVYSTPSWKVLVSIPQCPQSTCRHPWATFLYRLLKWDNMRKKPVICIMQGLFPKMSKCFPTLPRIPFAKSDSMSRNLLTHCSLFQKSVQVALYKSIF